MEWQKDKKQHAIIGGLLGVIGSCMIYITNSASVGTFLGVIILSNLLFFGKEYYDCKKPKPTGFSWDDIIAGNVGLFGTIIIASFLI